MIIEQIQTEHSPESLAERLSDQPGVALLLTGTRQKVADRFSILAAQPFLTFSSTGSKCQWRGASGACRAQFGNPWEVLHPIVSAFELTREPDVPFPLGACIGYFGYELGRFCDPALRSLGRGVPGINECSIGFYDSLLAWDHLLGKVFLVCTGFQQDGVRTMARAREAQQRWHRWLESPLSPNTPSSGPSPAEVVSNMQREAFIARVVNAQQFIRAGDIYQVNLAQRFSARLRMTPWALFQRLAAASPAPMACHYDAGTHQLVSSSPELFLKVSARRIITRPIKGTRPRSAEPFRDTQLAFELQTSSKEAAELVMITDLLRNDLGRVCAFGSIHVPELMALERYAHVQHLVSTVEGELRPEMTHLEALRSCFPGGSITGAPKIRAMQIINQLEPCPRGAYTGAFGYLGWNGESQFNILIRTAIVQRQTARFHAGAGIVADSDPAAEYDETLAKARGFFEAVNCCPERSFAAARVTYG